MNTSHNLTRLALREAALRVLADAVSNQLKDARAAMQQAMADTGASRVDATLPDGTKVASSSTTTPKPKAVVTDEQAFTAWVRDHHPTEVTSRVVTEVRPAYRTQLLTEMTRAGAPEVADQATGELREVPGVELRTARAASHSVRFAEGGAEAIVAAWRGGALSDLDVPQLMPGAPLQEAPSAE